MDFQRFSVIVIIGIQSDTHKQKQLKIIFTYVWNIFKHVKKVLSQRKEK